MRKTLILPVLVLFSGCASVTATRHLDGSFTWHSRTLFKDVHEVHAENHSEAGLFTFELGGSEVQLTPAQLEAALCLLLPSAC